MRKLKNLVNLEFTVHILFVIEIIKSYHLCNCNNIMLSLLSFPIFLPIFLIQPSTTKKVFKINTYVTFHRLNYKLIVLRKSKNVGFFIATWVYSHQTAKQMKKRIDHLFLWETCLLAVNNPMRNFVMIFRGHISSVF